VASRSSSSARGNWEDNTCKQHKVNSGRVANFHATTNSVLSHGGYGYSLPWYRLVNTPITPVLCKYNLFRVVIR
jgi:pre-mRNA 3'-end-processing factor FIP1